jgi:chromosome partitioning protein
MNIVVSNVKGGVGKTTTAVYLAAVAVERGWEPVTVVDADRQASSAEWFEESPIEGVDLVEAPSERTVARALAATDGLAVVDTPPGDERIVRAAVDRADAVVIPTRAGGVEYSRVWGIIPERVGIAAGPEARLYRDGLDAYDAVLKKALRKRPG